MNIQESHKIEASILMAISEFDAKRDSLINTLYSIAKQKTSFNFELCVVDDKSGIKIENLLNVFFKNNPNPNLKRIVVKTLEEKLGFTGAPAQAIKITSPESQKMFILASDCVLLKETSIEKIINRLQTRKTIVLSEVAEVKNITYRFHKNFYENASKIINQWQTHVMTKPLMVSRLNPHSWLFFAGAAFKKDLLSIDYDKVSCDAVLWQKMMPKDWSAEIITSIPVAHQSHPRTAYPCPRVSECNFYCNRTAKLKNIPQPALRKNADIIFETPEEITTELKL